MQGVSNCLQKVMFKMFISDDDCKVRAICLPEMKKDHLYSVFLTTGSTSCNVKKAECSCPAGNGPLGSCKHIAVLYFCLEDFVKSRKAIINAGERACTSMHCSRNGTNLENIVWTQKDIYPSDVLAQPMLIKKINGQKEKHMIHTHYQ